MNAKQMILIGRGKVPDGYHLMDYKSFIEFLHHPTHKEGVTVLDRVRSTVPGTLIKTLSGTVNISTTGFQIVVKDTDICVVESDDAPFQRFIGLFPPSVIDL